MGRKIVFEYIPSEQEKEENWLMVELRHVIEAEDYERAAEIRDEINGKHDNISYVM